MLLSKLGVPAINIVSTEVYEALKRGTVDGNVNNPEWARVYNFHEASKYWYDMPVGGFIFFSIINKDFFNKLPADLQKLLMSLRDQQAEANYMIYDVASDERARGIMYKTLEVIKPPQADIDQFLKIAKETVWTTGSKRLRKRDCRAKSCLTAGCTGMITIPNSLILPTPVLSPIEPAEEDRSGRNLKREAKYEH